MVDVSGRNKLAQEDESIKLQDYLVNNGKLMDDESGIIGDDMIEAPVADECFSPDQLFCDSHLKNKKTGKRLIQRHDESMIPSQRFCANIC